MTQTPDLLVTGASGHLGKAVLKHLVETLNVPAARIVATSRRPEELGDWAARGVTVRKADYDDPAGLAAAFAGVDRLLLISTDALDEVGKRLRQHKAAIAAAASAGVKHVVTPPCQTRASLVSFAPDHADRSRHQGRRLRGLHPASQHLVCRKRAAFPAQRARNGHLVHGGRQWRHLLHRPRRSGAGRSYRAGLGLRRQAHPRPLRQQTLYGRSGGGTGPQGDRQAAAGRAGSGRGAGSGHHRSRPAGAGGARLRLLRRGSRSRQPRRLAGRVQGTHRPRPAALRRLVRQERRPGAEKEPDDSQW